MGSRLEEVESESLPANYIGCDGGCSNEYSALRSRAWLGSTICVCAMFRHLTRCNSKGALGRLSSTNLRELQSWVSTDNVYQQNFTRFVYYSFQPLKRHDFHLVVTLDPNRFSEKKQKPFNIGDLTCFKPYIALHNHWSPVKVFTGLYYCRRKMSTSLLEKLPTFPPDTKAFLYYFRPPDRPLIAGELRLRVTSSDDPASFESGSDLLGINYRPWSRPLFLVSKYNIPLYEKLREELLVSDKLDAILSTFPKKRLGGQYHLQHHRSSQLLYRLNDTFIIDFSYFLRQLTVITEQGMETMKFSSHISETRPKQWTPYTGA